MSKNLLIAAALAAFSFAAPAYATDLSVPADGKIANNAAAQGGTCQKVCEKVKWNGQWSTTVQGKMSVCGTPFGNVDAGPIWNQADAEKKCPVVTKATFNGSWTNETGKPNAVCGCSSGKPFAR